MKKEEKDIALVEYIDKYFIKEIKEIIDEGHPFLGAILIINGTRLLINKGFLKNESLSKGLYIALELCLKGRPIGYSLSWKGHDADYDHLETYNGELNIEVDGLHKEFVELCESIKEKIKGDDKSFMRE